MIRVVAIALASVAYVWVLIHVFGTLSNQGHSYSKPAPVLYLKDPSRVGAS